MLVLSLERKTKVLSSLIRFGSRWLRSEAIESGWESRLRAKFRSTGKRCTQRSPRPLSPRRQLKNRRRNRSIRTPPQENERVRGTFFLKR